MTKKTRDQFKAAFRKTIKKPAREVPSALKDNLEKAVSDGNDFAFVANLEKIRAIDPDYLADLVAYKLVKHSGKDDKQAYWNDKVPKDIRQAALYKLLDDAMARNDKDALAAVHARDPIIAIDYLLDRRDNAIAAKLRANTAGKEALARNEPEVAKAQFEIETDQQKLEQATNSDLTRLMPFQDFNKVQKDMLEHLFASRNAQAIPRMSETLKNKELTTHDLKEVVLKDPEYFVGEVLMGIDSTARMAVLKNPALRDELAEAAPEQWAALQETLPMLKLFDKVDEQIADLEKPPDVTQDEDYRKTVAARLFAGLLAQEDVKIAYIGTNVGNPSEIIAGTDNGEGEEAPRTDCHSVVNLLQYLVEAYPGLQGATIKQVHCPTMLMTKKLSTIAGNGTLDKSYTGNVFDDNKAAMGKILFTGESGINSHTWLVVDGVPFDPVLGTTGTAVTGASELEFESKIGRTVGKSGDWYFVKHADLKPAPSPMGFSDGFYVTQHPERYCTPEECEQLGIQPVLEDNL